MGDGAVARSERADARDCTLRAAIPANHSLRVHIEPFIVSTVTAGRKTNLRASMQDTILCNLYAICIHDMIACDSEPTGWDQTLTAAKQKPGSSAKQIFPVPGK